MDRFLFGFPSLHNLALYLGDILTKPAITTPNSPTMAPVRTYWLYGVGAFHCKLPTTMAPDTFDYEIQRFHDEETAITWTKKLFQMKCKLDSIKLNGSSPAECRVWLNNAYRFRDLYGAAKVPMDVRGWVNELERMLQVEETVW